MPRNKKPITYEDLLDGTSNLSKQDMKNLSPIALEIMAMKWMLVLKRLF